MSKVSKFSEIVLINKLADNIWICISGALCHLVNDDKYMYDVKMIEEKIKI